MQLFTKSTGSASEWFLSTMYLSLVGLFPAVGHTKKAVIPPRDFSSSANMLFRLIIYVENIENLTYFASTKKPGYPHFFKEGNRRYCFKQPEILRTHTYRHRLTKENSEKLVLICSPSLYPQPSSPKLWTFPAGCLRDGW